MVGGGVWGERGRETGEEGEAAGKVIGAWWGNLVELGSPGSVQRKRGCNRWAVGGHRMHRRVGGLALSCRATGVLDEAAPRAPNDFIING